jgi:sulfoquinovosidase
VLGPDGAPSTIDFGEFDCGTIDLTSPAAAAWLRERIITRNMLELGISGWMADFGEYLPTDVVLASGADPAAEHNLWPVRWAQANAEAVEAAGGTGDVVFFMRAGFTGTQAHCPLLWGGDQSVDFSRHDGLPTVIVAALSSGLMGNAFHHSDIGGYTSLFGNVRTPELFMRWAEMAAFTPVMRTHESNRPQANVQWFDTAELTGHLVRMARVHAALGPYLRGLVAEAAERGLPVQRPFFLHFDDPAALDVDDAYLFGPDMLVAPVMAAGAATRRVICRRGPGGCICGAGAGIRAADRSPWTRRWGSRPSSGGKARRRRSCSRGSRRRRRGDRGGTRGEGRDGLGPMGSRAGARVYQRKFRSFCVVLP